MLPPYLATNLHRLQQTLGDVPFTSDEALTSLSISRSFLFKILHELVETGHLIRLGRGIYVVNRSPSRPRLPPPPSESGQHIHQALYPEGIDFAITGLDILLAFTHQLLVCFPHLVYVERGSAEWAKETLKQAGFPALIEPTEREVRIGLELTEGAELVILRQTTDFYDVEDGWASLERALVDLYFESTRRGYTIPVDEVGRILLNALRSTTVNYSRLLRWAMRRRVDAELRDVLAGFAAYLPIPAVILEGEWERSRHTAVMRQVVGVEAR